MREWATTLPTSATALATTQKARSLQPFSMHEFGRHFIHGDISILMPGMLPGCHRQAEG